MRYFRRHWAEDRGDQFASWGGATFFFEIDESGYPLRQMEIYDCGIVLKYDVHHFSDDYGGLADKPLDEADFSPFEISEVAFLETWSSSRAING